MQALIDFTDCEPGFREYGGSDTKMSIEYNGRKYMLKFPDHKEKKQIEKNKITSVVLFFCKKNQNLHYKKVQNPKKMLFYL